MKIILSILSLVLLSAGLLNAESLPEAKKVVSEYLQAATQQNGQRVTECLTPDTFKVWDTILNYARTGSKSDVAGLSLYRQLTILWIRKTYGKELDSLTGRSYVEKSFSNGHNSKSALSKLYGLTKEIKWDVRKEKDGSGVLYFELQGEWHPAPGLSLSDVNGVWGIDGVHQVEVMEGRIHEQWKGSGLTQEEFLSSHFKMIIDN